jgi:hypothetical protein
MGTPVGFETLDWNIIPTSPVPPAPKVAYSTQRTEVPFPTTYVDGRSWKQYFEDYFSALHKDDGVEEDEDDSPAYTILVPGHETTEKPPSALGTWRKRLETAGWLVKVGVAVARREAVYYADRRRGIKDVAREETTWWLNAAKPDGRYITVTYVYTDGKAIASRTSRTANNAPGLLTDAYLQELVNE